VKRKSRLISLAALLLTSAAFLHPAAVAAAPPVKPLEKIAVVDLQRCILETVQGTKAKKDLEAAFAKGQIAGDDIYYLGVRLEHILGKLPLGINSDLRVGLLLEGAHVGEYYTETNLKGTDFLNSTSLYLGGATPIGPLYLGYGYSTNGSSNLYFSLGIPFGTP
jgi:hypothetical protein